MDAIRSIQRIAEVLRETGAEIACVQEVHRRLPWSGFQDQPARLSRALGMSRVFQNNYPIGVGGYGNLLLARLPILSHRSHHLPNARERARILHSPERRGLLETLIETAAGPLAVMVTHWSLDAEDRYEAVEVACRAVEAQSAPVLLAGDFNAEAGSGEIRELLARTGLIDAAADMPEPTFPADTPRMRIDFVLHSPQIAVTRTWTMTTGASDHRPLVVEW